MKRSFPLYCLEGIFSGLEQDGGQLEESVYLAVLLKNSVDMFMVSLSANVRAPSVGLDRLAFS